MEVTPEGTFYRDPSGNLVLIFGVPPPQVDDTAARLEALKQKEEADRVSMIAFLSQTAASMQRQLLLWEEANRPDSYILASTELDPPSKCSDGSVRTKAEYIFYLTGRTLQDWFVSMNTNVSGMRFEPCLPYSSIEIRAFNQH